METQSPRAFFTMHWRLAPPVSACSSCFGMVPFSSVKKHLPIRCWQDQVPSFLRNPTQIPTIIMSSAASTKVIILSFSSTASLGILALENLIPFKLSSFQKLSNHLLLIVSGIGSVQPRVCLVVFLTSNFIPASKGANLPVRSHTEASLETAIFLVSFLGVKLSISSMLPLNLGTLSSIFPLLTGPKCKSGIGISTMSNLGYHLRPATPTVTPVLLTASGGSDPEKVQPLQVNPILAKTSSACLAISLRAAIILLDSAKSSTYLHHLMRAARRGNSFSIFLATSSKACSV